jgi:hypothetical protein
VAEMKLPQPGEEQGLKVSLSRDKIAAVATYNTSFGYKVTASANHDDVSYRWKRIGGDDRIYTKTAEGDTVEVVIPKNVEGVSARFEVSAESRMGEDTKVVEVVALSPEAEIAGPASMASQQPARFTAQANFDDVRFEWSLLKGSQTVNDGISQDGLVISGLEAGSYVVKVVARSDKGARVATKSHSLKITGEEPGGDSDWVYGSQYKNGDVVKHNGKFFECVQAGWCSQTNEWSKLHYEPGKGLKLDHGLEITLTDNQA